MDDEFEDSLERFKRDLLEEIKKNTVILSDKMDALSTLRR